jgi:co-chaperonin GroES (HSP10)
MANYLPIHSASKITALRDHIIVEGIQFGERKTGGGIIVLDDDGKTQGIRARWGLVHAIGPTQEDVKVGQWVLIEHGRWTRALKIEIEGVVKQISRVDAEGILAVSDEAPDDKAETWAGAHITHA